MQAQQAMVAGQPSPLLLQAVSKVEQVVARLQELQSSITGLHLGALNTKSHRHSPPDVPPSSRIPDLLEFTPNRSTVMQIPVSGESRRLSQSKSPLSASKEERRKSLTVADGWRHWSSPAKDVHDVISEILLASQFTKQIADFVAGGSRKEPQAEKCSFSNTAPEATIRSSTESTSDGDSFSKKPLRQSMRALIESTVSHAHDSATTTLKSTVDSLDKTSITGLPSHRAAHLNSHSTVKKLKPPPHLFKVVTATEGPAAKAGRVSIARPCEARRSLTTPSPLYKGRPGTLVSKRHSVSKLLTTPSHPRSPSSSINVRGSLEKKSRLQHSGSGRGKEERVVEACRASIDESTQVKSSREVGHDSSVDLSSTLPRPLSFVSPASAVRAKASTRRNKNWLTQRFSKGRIDSSTGVGFSGKSRKNSGAASNLPTFISRLPPRKLDPTAVSKTVPKMLLTSPVKKLTTEFLPLPPAQYLESVTKSTPGMTMKSTKDTKLGYMSYTVGNLSSSRELCTLDSNSTGEKQKVELAKDVSVQPLWRSSMNKRPAIGALDSTSTRPKAGEKYGKENNTKADQHLFGGRNTTAARHTSGTSLLKRAKGWVSLHKTKDLKGGENVVSSQTALVAR